MNMISTRTHGMLDYTVGILLILAPWLFGFANDGAAMWVPVILGAGTIVYSMMTNYEMSVSRVIPMRTHLWIDGLAGLFLAASPWLFDFADLVFWPHLIVGLLEIGAALMTEATPGVAWSDSARA